MNENQPGKVEEHDQSTVAKEKKRFAEISVNEVFES